MNDAAADTADPEPALRADWRVWLLALVALLGVGVVAALIVTQNRTTHARDEALQSQSHSYELMIRAQALSGSLARAEATLGRYVISGEKGLGRTYYEQWVQAGDQLAALAAFTRESPAQQKRIAALRRAYDERGKELAKIALYANYRRAMAALRYYYDARESRPLTELNRQIDVIIESERHLIATQRAAVELSVQRSNSVTRMLSGVGLLIVFGAVVLGWLMIAAITERSVATAEASDERERAFDLQRAVEAATAELRQEARERESAEAKLRQAQKMEAVGQLTGGIAHDFNNMLAVVIGGLELARRRLAEDGRDAHRHIEHAMEGANRAAALTRRLLAFSRAEPMLPEAVDPASLVEGMSELLDRTLGDTIAVVAEDDGLGWRTWVDRNQLENAVLNLVVNARDAMNGRGTVRIVTGGRHLEQHAIAECAAGDYATIAVHDEGCGMTPDVIERVFEPFFTTKPVGKGTGLGLSQIFGFARQSGGDVTIDSAPGDGTIVTVFLPRHSAAAVPRASEAMPAEPRPPRRGLDILVVEDDPRVLATTIAALAELGHHPIPCADPLEAPAIVEELEALDLIMSDVLMPNQTGPELIALLKPDLPDVRVLFVTGFAGEALSKDVLGGHPTLRKPFTLAALDRAVDDAMAGSVAGSPSRVAANA